MSEARIWHSIAWQWRCLVQPYLDGRGHRAETEGLVATGWQGLRSRLVLPGAALGRRRFVAEVLRRQGQPIELPALRRDFAGECRERAAAALCADCLEFLEIPETKREQTAAAVWGLLNGRVCSDLSLAPALLVAGLCHTAARRDVVIVFATEDQRDHFSGCWQPAIERYMALCLRGDGRTLSLSTAGELAQAQVQRRLGREPTLHPWLLPLADDRAERAPEVLLVYDAGQVLLDQATHPVSLLSEAADDREVVERISIWTLFAGEELLAGIHAGDSLAAREIRRRYRVACERGKPGLPPRSTVVEPDAGQLGEALASALAPTCLVWLPLVGEEWLRQLAASLGERCGAELFQADKYHGVLLRIGDPGSGPVPLHIIGVPPEPRLQQQLLAQHWMPGVSETICWINLDGMNALAESKGERAILALLQRCPAGLRHSMLSRLERRLGQRAAFMRQRAIHTEKQLAKTLAFTRHLRH